MALVSIVDDDEAIRRALRRLFRSAGFEVEAFASGEDFLNSGDLQGAACLVLDVRMPGMSGLELQTELNSRRCQIPIVFLTAHNDEEARSQALKGGALDFLSKPFTEDSLIRNVNVAIEQHRRRPHQPEGARTL